MAEGKKSFIAYCDWIDIFKELTNEEAGILIKHILDFVNDKDPVLEDRMIRLCFVSIKQSLKRDLKKYEKYIEKQRVNGAKGGRPVKTQITQAFLEKPKKADSVSVNDNVITNVIKYSEKDFLSDWNELRTQHLKKPSHVNRIGSHDDKNNFRDLCKDYKRDDFKNALIGLFKQKKMPNDNTTMQSNPSHFLKFFNSYLTAYHDKNTMLYGKKEKENRL